MVKTVLNKLVKLFGTAIKGHISMVPIDLESQPIILAYIDLNIQVIYQYMINWFMSKLKYNTFHLLL